MKHLPSLRLALFLVCLVILLWGTLRPISPPELFESSDKWLHLISFFALAITSQFAFIKLDQKVLWTLLFISAPALEFLQHLMQQSRTFSWLDISANLIGVVIALAAWKLIRR